MSISTRGSTSFGRDRSQRASAARQQAEGWVRQLRNGSSPAETKELSSGVLLSLAFPDRVARNRGNGSFVLANGRGASVDQASALARAPFLAVGEVTGAAANSRILLAAPLSLTEIEQRFAGRDRSGGRDRLRCRIDGVARPAQAQAACGHARRADDAAVAECRHRAHFRRWPRAGRPRAAALVKGAAAVARSGDVPAKSGR